MTWIAFASRAADGLCQEPHKFGGVVSRDALPLHAARGNLQGRIERERAAPKVLKAVPLALPRFEGQGRLHAVQGLNMTLLIEAQDDGMCRGSEIQTKNGRRLGFEVGVGAGDAVTSLMGSEPVASPETADEALRNAMPLGHDPARPVREGRWRALLPLGEDACLFAQRDGSGASRPGRVAQAWEPLGDKRCFQCWTMRGAKPTCWAVRRTDSLLARSRIVRVRRANRASTVPDRAILSRARRSGGGREGAQGLFMLGAQHEQSHRVTYFRLGPLGDVVRVPEAGRVARSPRKAS
jgi:hypothetical protein